MAHYSEPETEVGRSGIDTSDHDEPSGVVVVDLDEPTDIEIVNQG